jgi:hypothetical protein
MINARLLDEWSSAYAETNEAAHEKKKVTNQELAEYFHVTGNDETETCYKMVRLRSSRHTLKIYLSTIRIAKHHAQYECFGSRACCSTQTAVR